MTLHLYFRKRLKSIFIPLFLCCINSVAAKEFIIGVEDLSYYPLYDFSASSTSNPSFTRDLLTTFFDRKNYQYHFIALPIKRFDKWFVEQEIDFKFPDNFRWKKDEDDKLKIIFSEPVLQLMAGSYVLKSKPLASRNEIKKLGTILGFTPTLWFDKLEKNELTLTEEYSPFGVVKHLIYGNVDATNIDLNVINYNLKLLDKKNEVVLNTLIKHEVFTYHLSSINYPEIIKEFNIFLKENPSLVQQLKDKHGIKENF